MESKEPFMIHVCIHHWLAKFKDLYPEDLCLSWAVIKNYIFEVGSFNM